ncbi:Zinc finger CCCH domain-containing protein 18 [Sesamum alatum]|uniref:Zinc finger CCCH domain-containing protein 18 n=1 Tax=Sesamum alatum TaxID=300844 RepID=A0AAE2CWS9_9LAMI|nr:Zinc finger CCCH domain-containing protein 18 [Sesamum alatum]
MKVKVETAVVVVVESDEQRPRMGLRRLNLVMDYSESTKLVFQRIQKLEPENVSKIIGYLLLKDYGELEMLRLAFGPEYVIQSLIQNVKRELNLTPKPSLSAFVPASGPQRSLGSNLPTKFTPFIPASSRSTWPSAALPAENSQLISQVPIGQSVIQNLQYWPVPYSNSAAGGSNLENQAQFLSLEEQLGSSCSLAGSDFHAQNYCPELAKHQVVDKRSSSSSDLCPHLPESSMQICDNFRKGYCKYGGNCKYLHVLRMDNGYCMVLNPPSTDESVNGSVKQLERELIELLKCRRGIPVSISSLPILYYDKYGKVLQVEGYFSEAHRKGKVDCLLTQLLAQMTSCIRLIDRPHGQQSIILGEDIPRYLKFIEERHEQESGGVGTCQVYLTFPPQSIFSEQDVDNYFINYGPVREVRIPSQEKRMFGFVTFVYPETAALVLTKTNPHFIAGAQVLVKPYRQKPLIIERKTEEKAPYPILNIPHFPDTESKSPPTTKPCQNETSPKEQLIEENEQLVEPEKKHVLEMEATTSSSPIHASIIKNPSPPQGR